MKPVVRKRHERGAEIVEFSLVLLPMMAAITVMMDISWALFTKATLQRAVRVGVSAGTTLTGAQISSGCLTAAIKNVVQQNSFGLLSGSSGLSSIKVNYLQQTSGGAVTDVSAQTYGNMPGNIVQVSVPTFQLIPLLPRIVDWNSSPDNAAMTISVYSAGLIQPSQDLPCIGAAP